MDVSQLFNVTGGFGDLINSMTTNVTGSQDISLLLLLAIVVMIAIVLKLPELLWILAIIPLMIIFVYISASFGTILGILAVIVAMYLGKTLLFFR